jgi:hypothetical protein
MARLAALILGLMLVLSPVLPAAAQSADEAAANRLFVEAVQPWNQAEGELGRDRAATLQRVQSNLKTIIERHPGLALGYFGRW